MHQENIIDVRIKGTEGKEEDKDCSDFYNFMTRKKSEYSTE